MRSKRAADIRPGDRLVLLIGGERASGRVRWNDDAPRVMARCEGHPDAPAREIGWDFEGWRGDSEFPAGWDYVHPEARVALRS